MLKARLVPRTKMRPSAESNGAGRGLCLGFSYSRGAVGSTSAV